MQKVKRTVFRLTKNEFLNKQIEIISDIEAGDATWQDLNSFRRDNGIEEHLDSTRRNARLLRDYIDSGWIKPPDGEFTNLFNNKEAVSKNVDGSFTSEKVIPANKNELADDTYLLKEHGYDPNVWKVKSSKHSWWNAQKKGGVETTFYSSKLTVEKFKNNELSLSDIDDYFKNKDISFIKSNYIQTNYDPEGEVLEITLPDFHGGLLVWDGETGSGSYDIKIAKERFYKCLSDITERIGNRKFSKIYFVPLGDLLHSDTQAGTTTKGTVLDVDGRFSKYFNNTLDMMVDAIQILSKYSKIELPYISGNHDRIAGYAIVKAIEMAFRHYDNIFVDTSPNPRKYRREGNVLLGWVHGDMPKQNISEWLQTEARKDFGICEYTEVHAGHYHSQQVVEKSGMIVRYLPTICSSSSWEHSMGYPNGQKTVVSFVWNPKSGLREMWYSNI